MLCLACMCIVLLTVLCGVKHLYRNIRLPGSESWRIGEDIKSDNDEAAVDAALVKPQVYEAEEITQKLLELSEMSEDYKTIYENREQYPGDLLAALCSNQEMLDFVLGYPERTESAQGGFTEEEKEAQLPLLLQWDKRWGYVSYGNSCIGLSGCAPTCLSMVVLALTGNENATPDAIAAYAWQEGFYTEGTGTSWSFLTEGAAHWGVIGQEISLCRETVMGQLSAGNPIICSMRPGDFTTAGHFIVLAGVEDGKIRVNDPNSRARSSKLWEYDTLEGQVKNLWAYYN